MDNGIKSQHTLGQLHAKLRDVADFPKKGILFKDITPLLADGEAFRSLVLHLSALVPKGTTHLAVIESRGFILGSAMAFHLNLGLGLIRKPGKLPYHTHSHSYDLEYGQDTLHLHVDAFGAKDRVCIVDDILATGGTASAAETLCLKTGAQISGFVFFMELDFLKGRSKLKAPVFVPGAANAPAQAHL